jgi:hypothetical protein
MDPGMEPITRSGGRCPSAKILTLTTTFSPIAIRPSIAAEPICDSSTYIVERLIVEHLQPEVDGHLAIDSAGECGHENFGLAARNDQRGLAERFIVEVEATKKKLHHPSLDRIRELSGDDH